jgi:hypothetical protein
MSIKPSGLVIAQISPDKKDIEGNNLDSKIITDLNKIEEIFEKGTPMFIEFYLNGCPPCMNTAPKWHTMIEDAKKDPAIAGANLAIVSIESSMIGKITPKSKLYEIATNVKGFPTIGLIQHKVFKPYNGEREPDEFLNSVKRSLGKVQHAPGKVQHAPGKVQHAPGKVQEGGGWSKLFSKTTKHKRSHTMYKRSHTMYKRSHTKHKRSRRLRNKNTHRRRRY